ncbi:hypothetical protein HMPREF0454_03878 [Hafnia alvei ATCC 51873]|uniref:Uncharacterized protein n=1 Tax=Hafnia alvei ATCC 51873 TaxID=1002364 RepID=G9YB99_HAFAL|nr:hypothetical protein HMPREF0454_03878 [Hafnia alvei ATCC 51873]
MRQFVAGIDSAEVISAVNVVGAVDQPVGIEHDNGIYAHFAAALADFFMTIDGSLTATMVFTWKL